MATPAPMHMRTPPNAEPDGRLFPPDHRPPAKKSQSAWSLLWVLPLLVIGTCVAALVAGKMPNHSDAFVLDARCIDHPYDPDCVKHESTKHESSLFAKALVKCAPATPTSMTCSVESTGMGSAKACWDAVVECGSTTHRAHACSRAVPSGATESYAVRNFLPAFTDDTPSCASMRVENVTFE